jgi:hypothetical protein
MSNTSLLGSFGGQAGDALFFRNRIVNGCMRIDQRYAGAAAAMPAAAGYTIDRWKTRYSANGGTLGTATVQQSSIAPASFNKSYSITIGTARTVVSGDRYGLEQVIEGFNTADLAWGTADAKPVTLSFWVRSSLTGTFGVCFSNFSRGYAATYTINAANTWEYKTISIVGDTGGTWATDNTAGVLVSFDFGMGSDVRATPGSWQAGTFLGATGSVNLVSTAGATFYLTGVQLESGAATPFERRPIGTELALCQRYFETGSSMVFASTSVANSLYVNALAHFKVSKRKTPDTLTTKDFVGNSGRYSSFSASVDTIANNINAVIIFGLDSQVARLRFLWQPSGIDYVNFFTNWTADAEL